MGPTGSGKSTLASLLLKVYPVEDGKIFYGGQDLNRIPSAVLRTSVGYVPQDGFLFSDTIAHNIAFYDSGVTAEMVRWAAQRADILEDIQQFPAGFDTISGERGVTLSGGSKAAGLHCTGIGSSCASYDTGRLPFRCGRKDGAGNPP